MLKKWLTPAVGIGIIAVGTSLSWENLPWLRQQQSSNNNAIYDAVVVGGGVVGISVTRELALRGVKVALLEKEPHLVMGVSSGNSAIGCTGYDAPPNTLERTLLRRSIARHPEVYRSLGLSYDHVDKCGALVVAWTEEEVKSLPHIVTENHDAGDTEAEILSRERCLELEPTLSREVLGGAWVPRETAVEPWLVPMALAESARRHAADILTSTEVKRAHLVTHKKDGDNDDGLWTLETTNAQHRTIQTRIVINCAGLYGDDMEQMRADDTDKAALDFKIRPRKGQFAVFRMRAADELPRMIIQPVPTQYTKGVIVWSTVYGNVIVGPTAEEVESKTNRATDPSTIARLRQFGERVIPGLQNAELVGTYSGIRPATEHRDYQIISRAKHQWIQVAGIRSTGLSCATGIGEYVAELYEDTLPGNEHIPVAIPGKPRSMLAAGGSHGYPPYTPAKQVPLPSSVMPPIPSLQALAADFGERGDGTVMLWGKPQYVTAGISRFGLQRLYDAQTQQQN
jgi:glycerol-3-phosphate dehydrogenase